MSFLVELPEKYYAGDAFDGFAHGGGFTLGNGRAMAWMAQLAYESDLAKIDRRLAAWGLRRRARLDAPFSSVLPITSTRGLVASGAGAIIVAFAGTDPLVIANWFTDFDTRLTPDDLHRGFENAAAAVWPQLEPAIGADAPVVVTGHSMGAAVAAIIAERLQRTMPARPVSVYAFGMPRAGGAEFAVRYNAVLCERTYRLVYGDDAVPTVPPAAFNFRHVGRLLRCEHGAHFDAAELHADCNSNEPAIGPTLARGIRAGIMSRLPGTITIGGRDDWLGRLYNALLPRVIRDHLPDCYWRAFQGAP